MRRTTSSKWRMARKAALEAGDPAELIVRIQLSVSISTALRNRSMASKAAGAAGR